MRSISASAFHPIETASVWGIVDPDRRSDFSVLKALEASIVW